MAKKDQYQKSSLKDQEEVSKEIVPKTDLEIGSDFSADNSPEAGMNKRKQQQKKQ